MQRREKILAAISPAAKTGVEIGPLANPIVRRDEGRIHYADHATTAELREKYAGHGWDTATIVDVDVILSSGTGVSGALGPQSVDYVLASHVIEHVPDPLGGLADLHAALREEGVVSLVIPDKRYCFDVRRPESTTGELVDAFLASRTQPTVKQVYDFWSLYCAVDAGAVWSGAVDPLRLPYSGTRGNAYQKSLDASRATGYADVHCWVFTPASLLGNLGDAVELGILPFPLERCFPTAEGDLEFFVTLRRIDPARERADETARRADHFRREATAAAQVPAVVASRQRGTRSRLPAPVRRFGRPVFQVLEQIAPALASRLRQALRR